MNVREVEFWKITGQKTDKVYHVKITPLQSSTALPVRPQLSPNEFHANARNVSVDPWHAAKGRIAASSLLSVSENKSRASSSR
jgi:hypothetical protein